MPSWYTARVLLYPLAESQVTFEIVTVKEVHGGANRQPLLFLFERWLLEGTF